MTKIVNMTDNNATNGANTENTDEHPLPAEATTGEQLSDMACSALDLLCNQQEQSYDDFFKTFTHLKKDDITKQQYAKKFKMNAVDGTVTTESKPELKKSNLDTVVKVAQDVNNPDDEDEIIEILEDASSSTGGYMERPETPGSIVKLDNFVDDQGSNSEDDDLGGGYQPDFSPSSPGRAASNPDANLNTPSQEVQYDSTGAPVQSDTPPNTSGTVTSISQVNDDLTVKVADLKFPGEIEEVQISPRSCDIQNLRQLDFSTNPSATASDGYGHEDIENSSSGLVLKSQNQSGNGETVDSCDEIQPFSLDDDFDYDNVTLTPKYTTAEMAQISQGFQSKPK